MIGSEPGLQNRTPSLRICTTCKRERTALVKDIAPPLFNLRRRKDRTGDRAFRTAQLLNLRLPGLLLTGSRVYQVSTEMSLWPKALVSVSYPPLVLPAPNFSHTATSPPGRLLIKPTRETRHEKCVELNMYCRIWCTDPDAQSSRTLNQAAMVYGVLL